MAAAASLVAPVAAAVVASALVETAPVVCLLQTSFEASREVTGDGA
jgi:hypothetical protein